MAVAMAVAGDAAGNPEADGAGLWGAGVALVAFAAYVLTAAPTPYLLDSAQLAAASFGLGIAHPPGEPLALLWGKLWTLLPLGSVAFRVGVSQAAAGAAAAWLVFRLALVLVDRGDPGGNVGPRARRLLAATAALGFALSPGTVLSCNRPEVYALATALALGALAAACAPDPRGSLVGAVLVGLGIANHPFVAGMAGLGAVAAALPFLRAPKSIAAADARGAVGEIGPQGLSGARSSGPGTLPRGRLLALAVGGFVVGLGALAYLPLRALALYAAADADTILWGDARGAAGFWWIVSGKTFMNKSSIVHTGSMPEVLPFALGEEVGPALVLLAVAGLLYVARTAAARRPGLPVAAALGGSALAAIGAGFDPHNPDIRGYLGVALAATAVLGVVGLTAIVASIRRSGAALAAAAALALVTGLHALPLPARADLRGARAADWIGHQMLAEAPPRAALLTSHFETGFLLAYHRLVEGRRPDTVWAHLGFVRGPGYAARVSAAHPELAPLLQAHRQTALSPERLLALPRPVRIEPDQHLDLHLRAQLVPAGHLWQVSPTRTPSAHDAGPGPLPRELREEAARDRQVRGFLGWRAYVDGVLACSRGLTATAAQRLGELQDLLPRDDRARTLLSSCPTAQR